MNRNRQKASLPPSAVDRVLSAAAVLGLALLILTPVSLWRDLPEQIPMHFDTQGNPDGWGSRSTALALPLVGLLLYALLTAVARIPHAYSYPWPITPENRARQYALARRFVFLMRVFVVFLFAWAFVATARVATGASEGLGRLVLPVVLGLMLLILMGYVFAARRTR